MTIEEHIENLKAMASDMPSDKCSDWIESLMAGINAMEELKAHRGAWDGMKEGLLEMSRSHEYISIKHMIQLIDKVRPKEGENN